MSNDITNDSSSDSDIEDDVITEVPEEIRVAEHEQELQILTKRRQRMISGDGQILTSYKDVLNPVQRRTKQKTRSWM